MDRFPFSESVEYSYRRRFSKAKGGHKGTDIFAPKGTKVLAVAPGLAKSRIETKGGNVAYLEADNGTCYYYGHLETWALKLTARGEARVEAGDPIGIVGTSGSAEGTEPHVHFQTRIPIGFLGRTAVVDPFDELQKADPKHEAEPGFFDRTQEWLDSLSAAPVNAALLVGALYLLSQRGRD